MSLSGRKIAMLVENLYEDLEFWYPYYRMKEEGANVTVVGTGSSEVYKGKHGLEARPTYQLTKSLRRNSMRLSFPEGTPPTTFADILLS